MAFLFLIFFFSYSEMESNEGIVVKKTLFIEQNIEIKPLLIKFIVSFFNIDY